MIRLKYIVTQTQEATKDAFSWSNSSTFESTRKKILVLQTSFCSNFEWTIVSMQRVLLRCTFEHGAVELYTILQAENGFSNVYPKNSIGRIISLGNSMFSSSLDCCYDFQQIISFWSKSLLGFKITSEINFNHFWFTVVTDSWPASHFAIK